MVFSSLQFVLIFMPVFFAFYYLMPYKYKNAVLLLGSLTFYFIGTVSAPMHFVLFVFSILCDFAIGLGIEKHIKAKKYLLIAGILFHLVCLCTFKYSEFVFSELKKLFPQLNFAANVILPIGISFYTFQGISYIVDIYKGKVPAEKSLLNYAVYISMFEQLIAGPIVTYDKVESDLVKRKITPKNILNGAGTFIFGLGLKVLLANPLGKLWSQVSAIGFESISTPLAWMAITAYSFQIYFDFFGYSLMASGMGEMLGFKLPQNFNHPYTALTMTDFWRRWHITLGVWFKEYIYIPLGGSKKGKFKTIRNLFVVWLLTGIWHGAGYNFILWGLILFIIILLEKFCIGKYLNAFPHLGHIYMIFLIPVMWSIFAITDISQLGVLFSRLFPFFGQGVWSIFRYDYIKYLKEYFWFFVVGFLFSLKLPYRLLKKITKPHYCFLLLYLIFIASLYCMYRGFDDPFLYFRF